MKLLKELVDPNTINLTTMQMGVLVAIKLSPTPEVAFENTTGSLKYAHARNSLKLLGLIEVYNNKVILTPAGDEVILNYNLIDETGQMTERGEEVKAAYDAEATNKVDINTAT